MKQTTHTFSQLFEAINKAERILLVAHKKPDGDALGSSSAMLDWLLSQNKTVKIFCVDPPPPIYNYLDHIHLYQSDAEIFNEPHDLIIIFDSGDLRYCGVDKHLSKLPKPHQIANIDHHISNNHYGHINIVLPEMSSTCEIIYNFFTKLRTKISPQTATSLLTGILTDTFGFANSATTANCLQASSELMSLGARFPDILKNLLIDKNLDALKVWGLLLSRLQLNRDYDIACTYLLKNDLSRDTQNLVDGLSNFLNKVISETDAVLVLSELPDGFIKGSFRSVNRDISKLAKLMGGGGHKKAAGFTVKGKIAVTPQGPRIEY